MTIIITHDISGDAPGGITQTIYSDVTLLPTKEKNKILFCVGNATSCIHAFLLSELRGKASILIKA